MSPSSLPPNRKTHETLREQDEVNRPKSTRFKIPLNRSSKIEIVHTVDEVC